MMLFSDILSSIPLIAISLFTAAPPIKLSATIAPTETDLQGKVQRESNSLAIIFGALIIFPGGWGRGSPSRSAKRKEVGELIKKQSARLTV